MARKPFASLLAVAALGLALALALVLASLPPPIHDLLRRCDDSGGLCAGLLRIGHQVSGPLVLALVLWTLVTAARSGWRQWRQTRRALLRLRAHALRAPDGRLRQVCADLGVRGRVALVADEAPLAICWGLVRPRIWLSSGTLALLSTEELAAVLRHEREHLRRRHPLQLLAARALAAALPLLPMARELADALPRAQELAADRGVIRAGGRLALGRALLVLVEAQPRVAPIPLAAGMVGALDARLDQLTGAHAAPARISRRALAGTALTFGAGALLLWLSTLSMGPAQVVVAAQHLEALRAMNCWRYLVAPAALGVAAIELLATIGRSAR